VSARRSSPTFFGSIETTMPGLTATPPETSNGSAMSEPPVTLRTGTLTIRSAVSIEVFVARSPSIWRAKGATLRRCLGRVVYGPAPAGVRTWTSIQR
jgi:hypothetical protein